MGFILYFYINLGTNLLTGGPAQIVGFLPSLGFLEKEYQMESKQNETFGNVIFSTNVIQETWSVRHETNKVATRQGARPPPLWAPHCSTDVLLPSIYIHVPPPNNQEHHENLIPPPQPSVPERSHLGAFSRAPPKGALMEGLYINSMASSVMCE